MQRVFLSYARGDQKRAAGIVPQLRSLGLSVVNPGNFAPEAHHSAAVTLRLRELLQRAEMIVCVIGQHTASNPWVQWELDTATALGKTAVGLRIDSDAAIPESLKSSLILSLDHGQVPKDLLAAGAHS